MTKPFFGHEVVRQKLEALFSTVSGFERILGGEESQVFRFNSEDRQFIIRLNSSVQDFEKDRFVHERFARPELPIPKVFMIGQLEDHFYCISQRMPGRTLEDLDHQQVSGLLVPTRQVWQAIAKSDLGGISGCGPFNSSGVATFSTWRDFLLGVADTAKHDWDSVGLYTKVDVVKGWVDRLELLSATCPEQRALVHGDFGSNNVLTDGQYITSVVDWSEAMIGDPLYDVANIFFWRTWLSCMEQQAFYFEAHPPNVPDWEKLILCYQLRIGLSEVLENALDRRGEALIWALQRCEQIVRSIDAGSRA
ncbi:MAG: aminoglycoside phosphotransferase family protein [Bryobacteraceae bacterium]